MKNRLWVELERDPINEVNEKRAALLSAMLEKLGAQPNAIFYDRKAMLYCRVIDGAGSFTELGNDGAWFNLDFLGAQ